MDFISTKNHLNKVSGSYAIVHGIAEDGGLFVPESFPQLSQADFDKMLEMDFAERSAYIISKFLTEFTYDELLDFTKKSTARFNGDPAPVVKIKDGEFMLELINGPTLAFKDIALTLLPYVLKACAEKQKITEKIMILTATSGDTGKAALEGFKNVDGVSICVFYPSEGVAKLQKLQMTTTTGNNVYVAGVNGNFDDCQSAVKRAFTNPVFVKQLKEKGYILSSANSINFGRLVPQVVYYISAYLDLVNSGEVKFGDEINFCVPTGNFGNILAGYYAKQMGLPIGKLICASNKNNILTDFLTTGEYNLNREFFKTMSPSMDILISSNLERLIFELSGRNDVLTKMRMDELKKDKCYKITDEEKELYDKQFVAGCCDENETIESISSLFDEIAYCMDTHTAVAYKVFEDYKNQSKDSRKTVIISTASPYKFVTDVYYAITAEHVADAFRATRKLMNETAMPVPESLAELKTAEILFEDVISESEIEQTILNSIK